MENLTLKHIGIPLVVLATVLSLFLALKAAYAAGIYVDSKICPTIGSGTSVDPFCRISDALQFAKSFDTITVRSGTYAEDIIISKRAKILCDRKTPTYITGSGEGGAVLTITGSEPIVIEGCRVAGNSTQYPVQVLIDASQSLTLRYMAIEVGAEGTGIKILPMTQNMVFYSGVITGNGARYGIWLTPPTTPEGEKTNHIKISGTTISQFEVGILEQQCDSCPIQTNKFLNNGIGYQAEGSIRDQTFFNRFETNGIGLHIIGLQGSDHNSNTFVSNDVGLKLSQPTSSREEFNHNKFFVSEGQTPILIELLGDVWTTDYTQDTGCGNEWSDNSINGVTLPYYKPFC